MYQIAYIGRWETLPETAAAICDHDTPKLEALLKGGLEMCIRDSNPPVMRVLGREMALEPAQQLPQNNSA